MREQVKSVDSLVGNCENCSPMLLKLSLEYRNEFAWEGFPHRWHPSDESVLTLVLCKSLGGGGLYICAAIQVWEADRRISGSNLPRSILKAMSRSARCRRTFNWAIESF